MNISYFILLCSVKIIILIESLFQLCIYLIPEQIFAMIDKLLFIYDKDNKFIDVSLGIPPHIINITNSFRIFTIIDCRDNAFNIEKFCQLYAPLINYDHCILMISYSYENQLKYKFINLGTKKIMDTDVVEHFSNDANQKIPKEFGEAGFVEHRLLYDLC